MRELSQSRRTDEIDAAVHEMIIDNGAYPLPLGYGGFPKSVRTTVNECICHGIPDSLPLEDGDIINIDVTVYLNVTKECLDKAIAIRGPGVESKKIGKTIHEHADKYRYGVVREFVGHGNNDGGRMILNQTFTIGSPTSLESLAFPLHSKRNTFGVQIQQKFSFLLHQARNTFGVQIQQKFSFLLHQAKCQQKFSILKAEFNENLPL